MLISFPPQSETQSENIRQYGYMFYMLCKTSGHSVKEVLVGGDQEQQTAM